MDAILQLCKKSEDRENFYVWFLVKNKSIIGQDGKSNLMMGILVENSAVRGSCFSSKNRDRKKSRDLWSRMNEKNENVVYLQKTACPAGGSLSV